MHSISHLFVLACSAVIAFAIGSHFSLKDRFSRAVAQSKTLLRSHANDHVGFHVYDLNLTSVQLEMIEKVYMSDRVQSEAFRKSAAKSGWGHNRHQIFRYFAANHWLESHNGKAIEEYIVDTVQWREKFNIKNIAHDAIAPFIEKGLAYVSNPRLLLSSTEQQ
jgi:hypothetical protein